MIDRTINRVIATVLVGSVVPAASMASMASEGVANYPDRSISLVIGGPPGGGNDILARKLAAGMSEVLQQKVIIEYRLGASGNLAAKSVASADPDGYTIYLSTRSASLHQTMYPHIEYRYSRDLLPVAIVARMPVGILIGKHVAATSLREVVELARVNPGRITCATMGVGTTNHVLSKILQDAAGITLQHVPYQGPVAALADVIGGRVDVLFSPLSASIPFIKAGDVRALAVTSDMRVAEISDVPTVKEAGFAEIAEDDWFAILVPARTAPEIVSKLNRALNAAVGNREVRNALAKMGYVLPPSVSTPNVAVELIARDTTRWTRILQDQAIDGVQ